jgi:hypothetical protein
VAYCDDLGPVVLPVNYVLDNDTVLIQISPHSTLARHLRSRASFQIDDFDDYNQTGWSGWCATPAMSTAPSFPVGDTDRPHAWAEGQRTFYVRSSRTLSGPPSLPRLSSPLPAGAPNASTPSRDLVGTLRYIMHMRGRFVGSADYAACLGSRPARSDGSATRRQGRQLKPSPHIAIALPESVMQISP